MKVRGALALVLTSLLLAAGYAVADGFRTMLFNDKGEPSELARQIFDGPGSPARIVRGVDIPLAAQDKNGRWQVLTESACIVVNFRVSREGAVDKFMILDSQPKDLLAAATLSAMSKWQFEKPVAASWMVLPLEVGVGRSQRTESASRIPAVHPDIIEADRQRCLTPERQLQFQIPPGAEFADHGDPIYPAPNLLRTQPRGCATLAFRVAVDGTPSDLELLDAKPDQSFVDVAAADVTAWRFKLPVTAAGAKPRFGFARFDYGQRGEKPAVSQCMTAVFAAQHYQPLEQTP